jgi:hypothetical protein
MDVIGLSSKLSRYGTLVGTGVEIGAGTGTRAGRDARGEGTTISGARCTDTGVQASYHRATVHSENVTIAVFMKPEAEHDIGRIHYFHAANEQECSTWTKALQHAIANAAKRQRHAYMSAFHRTQIKLRSIYISDLMQYFVVSIILSNFVANIVEFELVSTDPAIIQRFTDLDLFFTMIFTLEFMANIASHLDMLPFAFMSDSWNILDLVVVLVSLFSVSAPVVEETDHSSVQDNGVKTLRMMRVMRYVYCIFMPTLARIVSVYSHYSTCIFLHAYAY